MFKKEINDIIQNNQGLKQVLNLKSIGEYEIDKLNLIINELNKTFKIYGINMKLNELMIYNLLNNIKNEIKDIDIENIKIKNYYKAGDNNYQENIGDLVLVKTTDNKKYLGYFLGSIPLDYKIENSNDKLTIEFENFNGLIYVFKLKKLVTTNEVWFKKLNNEISNKFDEGLKKLINDIQKEIKETNA